MKTDLKALKMDIVYVLNAAEGIHAIENDTNTI
jgi:hypothetical protein